ncbi:MAG: terminase small subunit [Burkholderiaceae bacterium]|jgi:phage terminase small subunit|nr:terminase small subunit [Burkholderiaceae bacterium]MCB1988919.1 terminase small subunit [Burkholderiaceae bacterium]MCO5110484.1 terminase small subunit [Burkholderiaceae bacterium]
MNTSAMTPRQARFVDEYLIDGNGTQAATRAGYGAAGARVAAHRLLTNVAISSAIEARQRADASRLAVDRERVLAGLLEAVQMARGQRNPAGMVAGLREIGKLMGFYAPERVKMALGPPAEQEMRRLEGLSDAELVAMMKAMQ